MTSSFRMVLRSLLCAFTLFPFVRPCAAQNIVATPTAALPNAPSALQEIAGGHEGSATISGVVSDIAGGLVPNASIKLQDKGHNTLRETTSDSAGSFTFANLAPGTYTVLISAKGLETFLSEAVTLKANARFELPDISLPIAAAHTSVDVAANSAAVADMELKVETEQRVLGVVPNYYTSFVFNAAPLTTRQKFRLSLHSTLDPFAFAATAVRAGIQQDENTFPSWGNDTVASYFKRYAADFGDGLIGRNLSSALFPAIFHQDPRYFYMGPSQPLKKRVWHAVSAGVIARGDNGRLQPNYSHLLGSASAGALSSVYHPASDSAQSLALNNALFSMSGTAIQCLLREFVWSHVTTHVPDYMKRRQGLAPTPVTSAPAPVPTPAATSPANPS